jgi:hypothetical protein
MVARYRANVARFGRKSSITLPIKKTPIKRAYNNLTHKQLNINKLSKNRGSLCKKIGKEYAKEKVWSKQKRV